jgi:hypothetical protein
MERKIMYLFVPVLIICGSNMPCVVFMYIPLIIEVLFRRSQYIIYLLNKLIRLKKKIGYINQKIGPLRKVSNKLPNVLGFNEQNITTWRTWS